MKFKKIRTMAQGFDDSGDLDHRLSCLELLKDCCYYCSHNQCLNCLALSEVCPL